ncbi:MAG TPA: MYXO-CTERM sorting domain-containing protein, partial [Kofleriaceae bacterium]|nr:MYXO-CTERM sorting domain-containing protein [Kofleriaceae bacterium]
VKAALAALAILLGATTASAGRRTAFGPGAAGFPRGLWDLDTGVPLQLVGAALPVPPEGARAFVARHIDLLAPGARPGDLALLLDRSGPERTIVFGQLAGGLPVIGARVALRFRRDRLIAVTSTARPHPVAALPARPVRRGPLAVLPVVERGRLSYRTVVAAEAGRGFRRERQWLDAATGEVLAREPVFRHATGTLLYDTPLRWPGGERAAFPAAFADVTVRRRATATTIDGTLTWPGGGGARVTTSVSGPFATVIDDAAAPASAELRLPDGGAATWSAAGDELADAQLTTFVHLNRVKEHARGIDPELAWLDQTIEATVNVPEFCNALSDGTRVYFFRGSPFCSNTGRMPDVVYHEFGHTLHQQALIDGEVEPALAEGLADYLAATITGDPGVARGFYLSDEPLRDIDPDGAEHVWPDDIDISDPHQTGRIIAGALWDLRAALVAELGDAGGRALADHLYYAALRHAVDIPTTYLEVLLADDDDGDLANGTPHRCDIDTAFARHGLADPDATGSIGSPEVSGLEVFVPVAPPATSCPPLEVAAMRLSWRRRGEEELGDPIGMTAAGGGFRAAIPGLVPGTAVDYRIEVVRASGDVELRPGNPADPLYQLYAGEVEVLYCTGFRDPPWAEGWTSGVYPPGGQSDWMWGQPWGGAGDPRDGFSGATVYGTDLGGIYGDGRYAPDQVTYADTPAIDVPPGAQQVRLQYRRWLAVEDASYDVAAISANGGLAWQNAPSSAGNVHHIDREWRFHDVDLTDLVVDGRVSVRFEIAADQDVQLGGWNLDDVCLVTFSAAPPGGGDAGPDVDPSALGDDGGCGCGAGGRPGGAAWLALVLVGQLRRRRRRVSGQRAQVGGEDGHHAPAQPDHHAGVDHAAPGLRQHADRDDQHDQSAVQDPHRDHAPPGGVE